MENVINAIKQFQYKGILAIVLVFALISSVLLVELRGVQANYNETTLPLLSREDVVLKTAACNALEKDTLLLHDSGSAASVQGYEEFSVILNDMKVGYDDVDLAVTPLPNFADYAVVIVLLSDFTPMGTGVVDLCDWVQTGGQAMFALTIDKNAYSSAIERKLGIVASFGYTHLEHIYVSSNFMLGGGKSFAVPDGYDSARTVELSPANTTVHAAQGDADGVPLIWETAYGQGRFVVCNFGMCDKAYRGFYSAALSLLTDVYLYPVINGSSFYLDDFPSQIPDGNSSYISRDYATTIRDFYINIWWPDMMALSDRYGIKYTGLAIECYDDSVDGTTDAAPDTGTFLNFGNMLLRKGGELGYHGYNHQPLCLGNSDYRGVYDYKTWDSYAAMKMAFDELVDFCDELFPDVPMSIYVPPSNLLSAEGREFLTTEYPHITTLSGIYLPDDVLDFCLLQEFDVASDGVVDQPRITSGCDVDDFMMLGALSELNLHFVNNHFTHPDDALDPERGAELGWETLYTRFDSYLSWLYTSAPGLRNFTGSELSAAVQRFAGITPQRTLTEDSMTLRLDNFVDDAQFLVRFNDKAPASVTGGTLSQLTDSLYLLDADSDTVIISFTQE